MIFDGIFVIKTPIAITKNDVIGARKNVRLKNSNKNTCSNEYKKSNDIIIKCMNIRRMFLKVTAGNRIFDK